MYQHLLQRTISGNRCTLEDRKGMPFRAKKIPLTTLFSIKNEKLLKDCIFLGFSRSGNLLISYTLEFDFVRTKYNYTLHLWLFKGPGRPLDLFLTIPLFSSGSQQPETTLSIEFFQLPNNQWIITGKTYGQSEGTPCKAHITLLPDVESGVFSQAGLFLCHICFEGELSKPIIELDAFLSNDDHLVVQSEGGLFIFHLDDTYLPLKDIPDKPRKSSKIYYIYHQISEGSSTNGLFIRKVVQWRFHPTLDCYMSKLNRKQTQASIDVKEYVYKVSYIDHHRITLHGLLSAQVQRVNRGSGYYLYKIVVEVDSQDGKVLQIQLSKPIPIKGLVSRKALYTKNGDQVSKMRQLRAIPESLAQRVRYLNNNSVLAGNNLSNLKHPIFPFFISPSS